MRRPLRGPGTTPVTEEPCGELVGVLLVRDAAAVFAAGPVSAAMRSWMRVTTDPSALSFAFFPRAVAIDVRGAAPAAGTAADLCVGASVSEVASLAAAAWAVGAAPCSAVACCASAVRGTIAAVESATVKTASRRDIEERRLVRRVSRRAARRKCGRDAGRLGEIRPA
jgi:hypothetical protein